MTITVSWWAIPALITLAAFCVAYWQAPDGSDGYGAGQIIGAAFFGLAAIASLIAWLVWALVA